MRSAALALCLAVSAALACQRQRTESSGTSTAQSNAEVLLEGTFEHAAKPVEGKAEILRQGSRFELRLHGVGVASDRPLRVYLVGTERASTTRSVVVTELKYDMDELQPGVAEQVIALPSEPDPALRSVVLWDPVFAVNVGFAALHRRPAGTAR